MAKINNCKCGSGEIYLMAEKKTDGRMGLRCDKCGSKTPFYKNFDDVVNFWNKEMSKGCE